MNRFKYLVYAPTYYAESGGSIVLHKLCHLLNEIGESASLYPAQNQNIIYAKEVTLKSFLKSKAAPLKNGYRKLTNRYYRTNPDFNTPIFDSASVDDNTIVIYPEITLGNPLKARHVVRWFLCTPGFHTGTIFVGQNELFFDYNSFCTGFSIPGCKLSSTRLKIVHVPTELYNLDGSLALHERSGTAYCLRKGAGRKLVHDTTDSVLIDGKSHVEVAAIFKRVKRFISYDLYTAYSGFAALCGAESVVVPQEGLSRDAWYPEESQYYGVSYGEDGVNKARRTAGLLLQQVRIEEEQMQGAVRQFVDECGEYFGTQTQKSPTPDRKQRLAEPD